MGDKGQASSKPPPNVVHQNAIMVETIKKEHRNQKLFTNYTVNPHGKPLCLADKPNRTVPAEFSEQTQSSLLTTLQKGKQTPKQKYSMPMTSSQEYGWDIEDDDMKKPPTVLHRPKETTELTRFMSEFWKQKEQANLGSQQTQEAAKK
ncbi:hypothetical protein PTSG_06497 [Salpingoeca rosetta]|uniref:Uncharacterized protein n=1 Tax=Salpingoeca rosetta (strain ATCC 50818 / BSB-021) TaxID=946362 RepID=F2UFZ3_SALR5|nr:uncharacterized protein PTSG_06497 [Salpingoeca rosetta]EGD75421.1 hypothetical protein PTSG_06497 [Salpingoeca rosetta]|eukprot:XP_004991878.1 hypothetical protein PTSG_06497 [Salpingoeca rosetta]